MGPRRRVAILAFILVLSIGTLGIQWATADTASGARTVGEGPYPGNTLISVQTYKSNDGRLIEVTPDGKTVWEFNPSTKSRVFDGEKLKNGNVLVAVADKLPPKRCPDQYLQYKKGHCIRNRVLELDGDTLNGSQKVVWRYAWYDEKMFGHEVHDVDRLPNGNTAIADMGNNRAFVANQSGNITWEWRAAKHLGPNSSFRQQYGGPENPGRERDWTHLNDIDRLDNGNFVLSIRNFDTVIEVNPETKKIVSMTGQPGNRSLMNHQHNPYRFTRWGTVLIADSENNRIVEIDRQSEEIIWKYGGKDLLRYPRDADRLPDGNTLITDTLNNRVIEINPQGEIVWEYEGVRIPYSADRLSVPEEEGKAIPGWRLNGRTEEAGTVVNLVRRLEGYARWVLPTWMRLPEMVTLLVGTLAGIGLVTEGVLAYRR